MTVLFIGNQIRLARPLLAAAVEQRRTSLFQSLARQQVEAGANWLLVDLGPQRKNAADDLAWLVQTIHTEISIPLALRSDDPSALEAGLQAAKDSVLIDATLPGVADPMAVSQTGNESFLSLAQRYGAKLAVSACPGGLPTPTEERLALVGDTLIPSALSSGVSLADLYIDPLMVALTCDQPMVPTTLETLRLLKVAADPAPNTIVHLDDVTDGLADLSKAYVTQAYVAMLLAVGVDALVANRQDPDLVDVMRVVSERDPATDYDRLLVRLYDVTKADLDLDIASVDETDPRQAALFKTVQVLSNEILYADGYLRT
jgi:5-methyltetrahydrofolate--homocysteine methyltransferase